MSPLWARLLPIPLLMAVLSCATLSPDQATLHEAKALAFLMETNEFASPHVGYGGTPSEQVIAFHAVLHSALAATLFQSLVERAHPVGKLYGLCGLYLTDRHAFERAVQPFLTSNERVATQYQCDMGSNTIAEIVARPGAIRLAEPVDLRKLMEEVDSARTEQCDIVGGCLPYTFAAFACDERL